MQVTLTIYKDITLYTTVKPLIVVKASISSISMQKLYSIRMPTTRVGEYLRIVLGILMVNIIDLINATLQKITLFEN